MARKCRGAALTAPGVAGHLGDADVVDCSTGTKTCATCGDKKPLSEFRGAPRTPDGKAKSCHECMAKRKASPKPCSVCRVVKQPSGFRVDNHRPDRRSDTCIECLETSRSPDGEKRCRGCLEWQSLSEFHSNGAGQSHPYCRVCRAERRGGGSRLAASALIDSGFKKCASCGKELSLDSFSTRSDRKRNPFSSECAECRSARERLNVPVLKGITPTRFEEILALQGGVCAICGASEPGGRGQWHIDHDHACCPGKKSCGKCVRGLLCNRCNPGIGLLRDDPSVLRRAADYLEAHSLCPKEVVPGDT